MYTLGREWDMMQVRGKWWQTMSKRILADMLKTTQFYETGAKVAERCN